MLRFLGLVLGAALLCACPQPPPAPSSLVARGFDGSVELSWGDQPAVSFTLLRGEKQGGPYAPIWTGTQTYATDSGLPAGVTRWYVARATDRGGDSPLSAEAHATTAPPAPGGLRLTLDGATALLEWDAVPTATAWQVQRSSDGGAYHSVGDPIIATRLQDGPLDPGTDYAWQVRAQGAGGPGAFSAPVRASTAPAAATGLALSAGGGAVIVRWAPSKGATSYTLSRSAGAGPLGVLATVAATSYADLAPPPGPLRYQVEPASAAGKGGAASAALVGDPDFTAVIARSRITWVSDGAEEVRPEDFTRDQYAILQRDAGGSWSRYAGYGSADGVLIFPGAQAGPYLLERVTAGPLSSRSLLAASAPALDFSRTAAGRASLAPATRDGTGVLLDIGGLVPWAGTVDGDGDSLELFSQGGSADGISYGPIAAGATSAARVPVDLGPAWLNGLISGPAGDVTWLTQFVASPLGGGEQSGVAGAWSGTSLAVQDGAMTPLQVALQPVPQQGATLAIRGAAYAALSPEIGSPDQPMFWSTLTQYVQPAGAAHGDFSAGPEVLWWSDGQFVAGLQDADRGLGPLSWGDPFPASWLRIGYLQTLYRKWLVAPGASQPARLFAMIEQQDEWGAFAGAPLEPRVSVPLQITVGGLPVDGPAAASGVGTAPLVAWQPPRLGTADRYTLYLRELRASGASTVLKPVASVRTAATSVQLPPGTLQAGSSYALSVKAEQLAGGWDSARPEAATPARRASGMAVSGPFTP